jgi:hypothetical protein
MIKWLSGLLDRAFAVIGAIVFAQAPLFMQEYTQQLIGRTAELRFQVNAMRHAASLSEKTLEQLTQKFMENSDPDVVLQGKVMFSIVERWQQLSEALTAMQESSIWGRPFAFIYHLNTDVFSSTFHQFKLGLPLNLEGGLYALVGLTTGYLFYTLIKNVFRKTKNIFLKIFRGHPKKQLS